MKKTQIVSRLIIRILKSKVLGSILSSNKMNLKKLLFQIPSTNGVFDFCGNEKERVYDHLTEMSEIGIRFRCSCPREYDDDGFFRAVSLLRFTCQTNLNDWSNGIYKHPAFRICRRCNVGYKHHLDIPETTWMLPIDICGLRIRDVAHFPRFVTTRSKPTEKPEDEFDVKWRLAYISAVMPIPDRLESDHLVSLQFLHRNNDLTRFYFDSTDGKIHPDTNPEKLMTDGQLLKKKCNEEILTRRPLPGKDITRRPQFAVYFRIP
jgi:hypothetical protein